MTALGAALVFFFKSINKRTLNGMLGFAAGVMIAASFWSLLAPAIDLAEQLAIGVEELRVDPHAPALGVARHGDR